MEKTINRSEHTFVKIWSKQLIGTHLCQTRSKQLIIANIPLSKYGANIPSSKYGANN